LETSEYLNELAAFSPKYGKRQLRIIEMNLEGMFGAFLK
jgi:hypothetical protein